MSYQQILNPGDASFNAAAPILGDEVSSFFQRENLRSGREFFGVDDGLSSWTFPTPDNVKKNMSFFRLNYMLIAAVTLGVNFLRFTNFKDWIGFAVLAIVWFFFVRATAASAGTLSILGQEIPEKTAAIGLGLVTAVFFLVVCGSAILHAFMQCLIVCGIHAAIRKAPSDDAGLMPG